jgi:hypothetical protein
MPQGKRPVASRSIRDGSGTEVDEEAVIAELVAGNTSTMTRLYRTYEGDLEMLAKLKSIQNRAVAKAREQDRSRRSGVHA